MPLLSSLLKQRLSGFPLSRTIDAWGRNGKVALLYARAWLHRRLHRGVTVVGITGSAAKTTTKNLCSAVLSEFGACLASERSMNRRGAVATLTLKLNRDSRFCVVELSASKPDCLGLPIHIVRPKVAVLTLIARDHYSAFKSIEAISREKGKLVTMLPADGVAVLNADDPWIRKIGEATDRRVVWVGESDIAHVRLVEACSAWPEPLILTVACNGTTLRIRTRLHGKHMAVSVLATLGVAVALDLPLDRVISVLEKVEPEEGRMQVVGAPDGVTFIRDDWKAPHWSVDAPLMFLRDAQASRKIVVIGSVSDSSLSPSKRYPSIAREVRKVAELAIFVGREATKALKARSTADDQSIQAFSRLEDANDYLNSVLRPGDLVLLKGTNKQDHLVRLVVSRSERVQCWQDDCGMERFCGRCQRLFAAPAATQSLDLSAARAGDAWYGDGAPSVSRAIRVIVGLGNAGDQYRHTPHNAGHDVLDGLAGPGDGLWVQTPEGAESFVEIDGCRVALLKPGAMMNAVGPPIRAFLQRIGGHPEKLIVVHDDIDLDLGDVRLKRGGGDAGHKGVRSVIAALGTADFHRVRIGVRKESDARKARQVVLEAFSGDDLDRLDQACVRAKGLIREEMRSLVNEPEQEG